MKAQELENYIQQGKIEDAINVVNSIGKSRDESCVDVLISHLRATENINLRNEIALALSDIGNNKAVDPLIEIIEHPKTKGSRGTLLYSLKELNYSPHITTITDFIGDSSLEVSVTSFSLLEKVIDELSDEQKTNCKRILKLKLENMDAVQEALEILE